MQQSSNGPIAWIVHATQLDNLMSVLELIEHVFYNPIITAPVYWATKFASSGTISSNMANLTIECQTYISPANKLANPMQK